MCALYNDSWDAQNFVDMEFGYKYRSISFELTSTVPSTDLIESHFLHPKWFVLHFSLWRCSLSAVYTANKWIRLCTLRLWKICRIIWKKIQTWKYWARWTTNNLGEMVLLTNTTTQWEVESLVSCICFENVSSIVDWLTLNLGDMLVSHDQSSQHWTNYRDIRFTLAYPTQGIGNIVSYVQVFVDQVWFIVLFMMNIV